MKLKKRMHIEFEDYPSASEWQLYDPESMEAKYAAARLNTEFVALVNEGLPLPRVYEQMCSLMERLDKFGANDTEPHSYLLGLLDRAYG